MSIKPKCGAKNRSGKACGKPAGWGTDHVGTGRCRLHGGASLKGSQTPAFKHGRYSKYAPQAISDKLKEYKDGDPLAVEDELAMQRALFANYMQSFEVGIPLTRADIDMMMGWLSDITKTVERVVKMRNDSALTASEVGYLQARVVDVVLKYIDDPDKQEQFVLDLFGSINDISNRDIITIEAKTRNK